MKKLLSVIICIAMILSMAACGSKKPNGTYVASLELGYLTFNSNGSFTFEFEDVNTGKYTIGDNNNVIFTADDSEDESQAFANEIIVTLLNSYGLTYDEKADALIGSGEGAGMTFTKTSKNAQINDTADEDMADTKEDSESNVTSQENNTTQESAEEPKKTTSSGNEYLDALDAYSGYAIENGYADDYSYLTKIAETDSNYYWSWACGGAFGVYEQAIDNPNRIDDVYRNLYMGDFTGLILESLYYYTGQVTTFDSLCSAYDTVEFINPDTQETLVGDLWIMYSGDNVYNFGITTIMDGDYEPYAVFNISDTGTILIGTQDM